MQIGKFAEVCRTRISVLRHYDKLGLLVPAYIDRFTGYRYYTEEQIHAYVHIAALKQAGFSLTEIKDILAQEHSDSDILALFDRKHADLTLTLRHLEEAKQMMTNTKNTMNITYEQTAEGLLATSEARNVNDFSKTCEQTETALAIDGYQRISAYRAMGEPMGEAVRAACLVVKLGEESITPHDDTDLPFEDDPSVVGKWQIMGTYAVEDDFFAGRLCDRRWWGDNVKVLHFLPNGQRYWCYGWTRGKVLFNNGSSSSVNPYTLQEYEGERYMFVSLKSYHYRRGGQPVVLVLRQLDHVARTKWDIARKDDVDLGFVLDERVLGAWQRYGSCRTVESFEPVSDREDEGFFRHLVLERDGSCTLQLGENSVRRVWTHGSILDKTAHTASAYRLLHVDGVEYLLAEWKNGDYIWGGMDPKYVVFTRDGEKTPS